jgi:DNA-binding IclR family transcriptional regulator
MDEFRSATKAGGKRPRALVQSVSRAAEIMQILLYAPPGKSLTQIADDLRLHKTTVLRLVRTLEFEGIVRHDRATGGYELNTAFWLGLAARNPDALAVPRAVQLLLDELAEAVDQTVVLALADTRRRAVLPAVWSASQHTVHVDPRYLGPLPMHAVAAGKCCLADLSEEELRAYIDDGLPRVTQNTITSAEDLVKELEAVRRLGYAVARGESIPSCGGVAVPIRDGSGQVLGGVQVQALMAEMSDADVQRWLPLLHTASSKLSSLLRLPSRPRNASDGEQAAAILPWYSDQPPG